LLDDIQVEELFFPYINFSGKHVGLIQFQVSFMCIIVEFDFFSS